MRILQKKGMAGMGESGAINAAQVAEFNGDANAVAEGINQIATVLHEGLIRRVDNLYHVHDDWTALLGAMQADGRSVAAVVLITIVSLTAGVAVLLLARELVARRGARLGGLLRTIGAIFLSAVVVVIASRIVTEDEPTRRLIILWSIQRDNQRHLHLGRGGALYNIDAARPAGQPKSA
jgi:hypothetical protein